MYTSNIMILIYHLKPDHWQRQLQWSNAQYNLTLWIQRICFEYFLLITASKHNISCRETLYIIFIHTKHIFIGRMWSQWSYVYYHKPFILKHNFLHLSYATVRYYATVICVNDIPAISCFRVCTLRVLYFILFNQLFCRV